MAQATGFQVDLESGDIRMNKGDTGSFKIHASLKSGDAWTEDSRMLFTVRNATGTVVMQRIYRLDDAWEIGDGVVLIEFHNSDTDTWENGMYDIEYRFNTDPIWDGTPSDARCVNALATGAAQMVEGSGTVRTVIHAVLTIEDVYGRI